VKAAIEKEKQIKSWTRQKKNDLIEEVNPNWEDLSEKLSMQYPSLRSG